LVGKSGKPGNKGRAGGLGLPESGTTRMNSRNRIKSNEISQAPWKNGNKMHFMRNYKGTTLRATQHRAINPPDTHPLFRSTERCNNGQRHAHWTNHKTHGQMFPTGFHVPRFPVQWPSHNAQMHLGSGVAGKRGTGEAGPKSRG